MFGLPQRTCLSNLKSASLAVLEQLAFNAQKIYGGYLTLATPPFPKIFKGDVWTVAGNVPVIFEDHSFNRVGIISTYFPKIRGHVTLATPTFRKMFKRSCLDSPWEHACQIRSS